jgi:hypothetical protein
VRVHADHHCCHQHAPSRHHQEGERGGHA